MKHEKHPWFIRDSNPVPLGQKSGALTTELTTENQGTLSCGKFTLAHQIFCFLAVPRRFWQGVF
jgi:hypothetical protein